MTKSKMIGQHSENINDNWWTPSYLIEAAREAMGSIDTDPASNYMANEIVQASTFYTAETNGLNHDWIGNTWLNPPFNTKVVPKFVTKFFEEYANGNMTQGIILLNANTDTSYGQMVLKESSVIFFTKGRVSFIDGDTGIAKGQNNKGQMIGYVGSKQGAVRFYKAFSKYGTCLLNPTKFDFY